MPYPQQRSGEWTRTRGRLRPNGLLSGKDAVTASTGSSTGVSVPSSGVDADNESVDQRQKGGGCSGNKRTNNLNCEHCTCQKCDGSEEGPNAHFYLYWIRVG